MNAPRSTVREPEILEGPAGDRLWLALARVLRGLEHLDPRPAAERAAATDTAGHCRPRGAGDQLTTTQDDRVSCRGKLDAVAVEDSRRDQHTSTDI